MWVRGEQLRVALETGVVEREARREHAEPLPGLHLPLITPPRDLRVEVEGGRGMERPRQALAIDHGRRAAHERIEGRCARWRRAM